MNNLMTSLLFSNTMFVGGQMNGIEFIFGDVNSRAADYVGDFADGV